ncbi:MFS transporter [Jatrophihabitans telluris]|uniref:MFS transporter n=1 Tax=Jatrophihabitans telluris TaxID=2038343 RepID=A0ABY4R0U2_9ACTN|nr:MFS transporter [Jatrophihabitans telluris]UQX88947.1 MFS transporter [Jatrophihabitans telluris]
MTAWGANGFLLATWFSRLPSMAERLHIPASQLGIVTLAMTVSTLLATPIAARRLPVWRATRIIRITAPLTAVAMLVAVTCTQVWQLAAALLLLGAVNGMQGIGLNAQGTMLARLAERTWMPAMLGAASAAGVVGAGIGSIATAQNIPVTTHLGIVTAICLAIVLTVSRQLPVGGGTSGVQILRAAASRAGARTRHGVELRPVARRRSGPATGHRVDVRQRTPVSAPRRRSARARPDRVIALLIGANVGATLAEGALANFGIVLFRDVLGAPISIAALSFTVFSIAMALVRLAGGWINDTFGPWFTLCAGGILTTICGLVLIARPPLWVGFAVLVGVAFGIGCAVPMTFQIATAHARRLASGKGTGSEAELERASAGALSNLGLATAGGYLSGGPVVGLAASMVGLRSAVLIVAVGGAALASCSAALSRWERSRG